MPAVAVFLNIRQKKRTMHFDKQLDARKLTCFMLTLRTRKLLDEVGPGGVLKITTATPDRSTNSRRIRS